MPNIIEFTYVQDLTEVVRPIFDSIKPFPIKNLLPEWYKELSTKGPQHPEQHPLKYQPTMKKCMPVMDYLTSGYIIPAWEELILYKNKYGNIEINTYVNGTGQRENYLRENKHDMRQLNTFSHTMLFDEYFGDLDRETFEEESGAGFWVSKLMNPWKIKTPKGYSCLFTRPWYHNQKINILPGIVDTDNFDMPINFPFMVNLKFKESYEIGIGDPLICVFPYKRDDWQMKISVDSSEPQPSPSVYNIVRDLYKKYVREKNGRSYN